MRLVVYRSATSAPPREPNIPPFLHPRSSPTRQPDHSADAALCPPRFLLCLIRVIRSIRGYFPWFLPFARVVALVLFVPLVFCSPRPLRLRTSVPLCEIRARPAHAPHSIPNADFPSRQMDQTSPFLPPPKINLRPTLTLPPQPLAPAAHFVSHSICVQLPCVTSVSIRNFTYCTDNSNPATRNQTMSSPPANRSSRIPNPSSTLPKCSSARPDRSRTAQLEPFARPLPRHKHHATNNFQLRPPKNHLPT